MKVYITGMGLISPLGNTPDELFLALKEHFSAISVFPELSQTQGLHSNIGASAKAYDRMSIPRPIRRSMSKMSEMALIATQNALQNANISLTDSTIDSERILLNLGSTTGSPEALETYYKTLFQTGFEGQFATNFFKVMNHTVAANVAAGLNYSGPLLSTSSACSTSTQSIILGYEMIQSGLYDVVIAGGSDELHRSTVGIFDLVQAASRKYNNTPEIASRPFDKERDGLVVAEGAGVIVMESEAHLKKRNTKPLAKILGGSYLCDGAHMSQPQIKSMSRCMQNALSRSRITHKDINYINAHATSTIIGDLEEGNAIYDVFGSETPISSLKGFMGHTLAACGAIETIATIKMMEENLLIPNKNLFCIDPNLPKINLLKENTYNIITRSLINNFAFGGLSSSLIIEKV